MYQFGLFMCGEDLHPLPRRILIRLAPKLKAEYQDKGNLPCLVFVLGDDEWTGERAINFGSPVNLVVLTEEDPGTGFLLDWGYNVTPPNSYIFVIPWVAGDLSNVLAESDLLGESKLESCDWLAGAREADDIAAAIQATVDKAMAGADDEMLKTLGEPLMRSVAELFS